MDDHRQSRTRIAIEEPTSGSPTIVLTTPAAVTAKFTDEGGGKIELSIPGGIDHHGFLGRIGANHSKVAVQATKPKSIPAR